MERNFILGALFVGAAALALGTTLKRDCDPDLNVAQAEATPAPQPNASTAKTARPPSSPIEERRDDALLAHVEHKYRYLLVDVESSHIEELKRRLLALEAEENTASKATTGAYVSEMLLPREREYYEVLKDSDAEQHHVAEDVGGIRSVGPLDQRQERQILDAKLRQKQHYATAIRDSGLDREVSSEPLR